MCERKQQGIDINFLAAASYEGRVASTPFVIAEPSRSPAMPPGRGGSRRARRAGAGRRTIGAAGFSRGAGGGGRYGADANFREVQCKMAAQLAAVATITTTLRKVRKAAGYPGGSFTSEAPMDDMAAAEEGDTGSEQDEFTIVVRNWIDIIYCSYYMFFNQCFLVINPITFRHILEART